jgi:5'-3' exonuclease
MAEEMILIDAFAQIYRGYYAIRYLTDSEGRPVNAIFAMAKFLLRMHHEYPSANGAVVIDRGKPQFRLEIQPEYKANRPPMPDDLRSQLDIIEELIEAFGWHVVGLEGYEADDLIAAIAVDCQDDSIRFVTADKDLCQIITNRVKMLAPNHKGGGLMLRGPDEVVEKFGIPPEKIIDYLALIGDSSDNIPGVQGVGPKTAVKLLLEAESIEKMLAQPELISNVKLRDKIVANTEILRRNIDLVTLRTDLPDAPWQSKPECLKRSAPDWEKIRLLCEEYNLNSIKRDIDALSDTPATAPVEPGNESNQPDMFTPDMFG